MTEKWKKMLMKENLEKYIRSSFGRVLNEQREFKIFDNVQVYVNEELPQNVDIRVVLDKVSEKVPAYLTSNLDSIQVGYINQFEKKNVNALYKNGTIYVTNYQDNNEDMVDDIVHEMAHAVEEVFTKDLYRDKKIENEFLGKRNRLFNLLKAEGVEVFESDFLNPKYSGEFDHFLYKNLGYDFLRNIAMGLFVSPYAITSLREYFANGFEEYYLNDRNYLRKISPNLYTKLAYLDSLKI